MHDENGNEHDGSFVVPTSILSGTGRSLKRSKSINNSRNPWIDLSPTPSPEEISSSHESSLPICLRRSSQWATLSPCGSFEELPTELIYNILKYLPLTSIGHLGQTSKDMRNILIRWTGTSRMQYRLMQTVLRTRLTSQKTWNGKLSLPSELHIECQRTGVLLKLLTCLFPTSQRLGLYYQLITEVKRGILERSPDYEPHLIAANAGIILHSMISGWDKRECTKVYSLLCQWNNIGSTLADYLKNPISTNANVERSLRIYLRSLFLDFAAPCDRSMWIGIVFDCPELSDHQDLAKLLLLLYAPLQPGGAIIWDFFEEDMEFASYTEQYKMLAETLAGIITPARKYYSPQQVVDVIQSLTGLPTLWPTRSAAAFLLCLHCVDSKPFITYFKHLSSNSHMGMAIEVLSNIFYIASEFISAEPLVIYDNRKFYRSVLNLIRNAINCGWSHDDRQAIVQEMWNEIRELCVNLLDDAVLIGNAEELHNLMETWKEISIQLTF
ncbi:F-box only protein 47 [Daphnia magna]|uniref:F-box only protein 47 n=1 Tax=Daphnia magna TaxID=35525 RepID=A0A164UGH2_9CRUS|nr:F-box only protein 47 [Daphnia magna]